MAIDSSVQYNGGFLPGIKTLDSILLPSGKEDWSLQPMIHLNVTLSPLNGGCSEDLDAFRFFFKKNATPDKDCIHGICKQKKTLGGC